MREVRRRFKRARETFLRSEEEEASCASEYEFSPVNRASQNRDEREPGE